MKKYINLAIALVVGVLTSCTDKDDIEIILHHDLSLNVNTQGAYETWGMSNFQNYLGNNKSKSIGVTTFIYGNNGSLFKKITTTTKTFQTVTQSVEGLEDGVYDVITFETIVNDDNKNESSAWKFVGEESLNTLMVSLQEDRSISYWHEAFAYAHKSINVGKESNVSIAPNALGCIINIEYENFDKAHYYYFSFSSRNNAEGYKLSPNINETDRFYRGEYDKSNLWEALGCFYSGKEECISDEDAVTIYTFEAGQRPYLFGGAKSMWVDDNTSFDDVLKGTFNFENGKYYEAFCYYAGKPDNFNVYLGLHDNFNSWYKNLDKTMNPVFAAPCTTWGSTVSYVKSFMKGYEILQDIEEGPYSYYMAYWGNYSENYIEYDFETKTTGLFSSYVCVWEEEATENDILSMLNETQYEYDQYYEEFGYHLYFDDKTYVVVTPNLSYDDGTGYTMVQYLSRAVADAEPSAAKARNIATSNRNSRIPTGLLKTNLKNVKKNK